MSALAQGSGGAKPAREVSVAEIAEQATPLQRVYTGTTAAVRGIELKAQVTGYLLERRFTEGSDVAKGDTLYVIDPAPFRAELDKTKAELQEQEAVLAYAKTTQERYAAAAGAGAAAQERLDQAIELQAKTEAAIGVSKADVALAQINLDFAEIRAPFDGRVGRTFVNIGALVQANSTPLATLVQLDPIYVYFSPPETELLAIEGKQREGRAGCPGHPATRLHRDVRRQADPHRQHRGRADRHHIDEGDDSESPRPPATWPVCPRRTGHRDHRIPGGAGESRFLDSGAALCHARRQGQQARETRGDARSAGGERWIHRR